MPFHTLLPLKVASSYASSIESSSALVTRTLSRPMTDNKKKCDPSSSPHLLPPNPLGASFGGNMQRRALVVGSVLGFTAQCISMFSRTYMTTIAASGDQSSFLFSQKILVLPLIMKFLSMVDVMVYALFWFQFLLTTTRSGFQIFKQTIFSPNPQPCYDDEDNDEDDDATRKTVFLNGVNILMGIVVGSFLAHLVSLFLFVGPHSAMVEIGPTLVVLIMDFLLCYFMVITYDWADDDRSSLSGNTTTQQYCNNNGVPTRDPIGDIV